MQMAWFVQPDSELFTRLVWTRVALFTGENGITRHEGFVYGMANHGIFRDFSLTQRAKFGDNPARFFATLRNFRSAVLRDFLRS